MADEKATPQESEEEALERVRQVRATQIFGDTPTDPTIGDVVVPSHDEEGAGVDLATANADAEDLEGDERDDLLSDEEVKRQGDTPQFDQAAEDLADSEDSDEADAAADADSADEADAPGEDAGSSSDLAKDKIAAIKSASSVEEVDVIAADDERVTVKEAADNRKTELSE